MRLNAVHKVVDHAVADVVAKLVVVHEDVTHGLGFEQLVGDTIEVFFVNITQKKMPSISLGLKTSDLFSAFLIK